MSLISRRSQSILAKQVAAHKRPFGLRCQQPIMAELHRQIATVIRGKDEVIREFLVAVIAGGSILLEDLPGVGKTTLAKTFAALVDLKFDRLQCTPDLLPSDVFGFSVFNARDSSFTFRPGPVFCNVLLADEINRATPRTQSALLEAMAEGQVTVDGECRKLETPFVVIATQNPAGFQGTYPLPEAQLDRFLMSLSIDYPDPESELELLYDQDGVSSEALSPILDQDELIALQAQARSLDVHRDVVEYVVRIANRTRSHEAIATGCSPRGTQMLFRAAQAHAFVSDRTSVIPDDVQAIASQVLAHRLSLRSASQDRRQEKVELVRAVLRDIPVPA